MTPPLAFLSALFVIFSVRELFPPVTGSGTVLGLAPFALLLALPPGIALAALRSIRQQLVSGRRAAVPSRALLRLSGIATPLVCWAVLGPGGWADLAARIAGSSHFADIGLLLLPVLFAEIPRLVIASAADYGVEALDSLAPDQAVAASSLPTWSDLRPVVRSRLSWPFLLLMPCTMYGLGLDLLQLHRGTHMFVLGTSPGAAFGALAFLAVAAVALPPWFRVAFGVVRSLPEPVGSHLRRTAASLGFGGSRVLMLPTGNRAMNAMMVGPLPIGRFLCLTDGILSSLDQDSLAGVVAHEVGHAKRSHPLLLMCLAVAVPLLLPAPLSLMHFPDLDVTTKALLLLVGVGVLLTLVRALAHRFEHEADAASVDALGAGPCTRALMAVSRLATPTTPGVLRRLLSLHPEEATRWNFMRRYETEPEFRARFRSNGRRLRVIAGSLLALAVIAAAITWFVEWRFEKAIWRFQSGDFRGASRLAADIGDDVPERWHEPWTRFREDLAVAIQVAPDAEDWPAARAGIEASAFRRGVEVLRSAGPAAAAPWFVLAHEVDASALSGAISDYCRATDDARREDAKRVVRRLGVPKGLEQVFAEQ